MKAFRIVLLVIASLAVLLAIALALAFTPGVQTWAARKFSPSSPELTVDIGRVNAGLRQTRVENIRVVQPGMVLTIPSAEVEVSVIDAVGGKIEVKRLVAKGWTLDLTAPLTPASRSAPGPQVSGQARALPAQERNDATLAVIGDEEAFNGILSLIQLPFDLAVDGVDLSGDVILPEGRAQVAITGGSLAAGREGRFVLAGEFADAAENKASVKGDLAARMDTPRSFERLGLVLAVSARGWVLSRGAAMDLELAAARDGQGESYLFAVRSGGRELARADVKLPAGTGPLTGSWTVDVNSADAAPVAAGQPLPDVVARGRGTFEASRTFSRFEATGALDASVDNLATVQPELAALGRLVIDAAFDVAVDGEVVRLGKLSAKVTGTRPVASLVASQPVEVNTGTMAVSAPDPSAPLVSLKLDGIPLAWARPFLGDLVVTGDDVQGEFSVKAGSDGVAVRPVSPVSLKNLSVSLAGEPLARALDISLSAEADYTARGWTARIADLAVNSAGAPLLKLSATASQETGQAGQPLKASGTYEVNLPAALGQPAAAGSLALARGVARGSFDASVAEVQSATLTLQLADLVAAGGAAGPLPSVALQARADIDPSGRIDAKVPVVVTQAGRRSDLTLAAVVIPAEKTTDIQASLTGDTVHVNDLMAFSALSAESAPAGPAAPSAPATRPAGPASSPASPGGAAPPVEPLWAGVTGELKLALKTVVYSTDVQATNVTGSVKITPAALTLENIAAALTSGGSLKAGGGLQFDAAQEQPYALKADLAFTDVDPAPLLRALSPGQPSPVEGRFDLATQLSGRALEPAGFTESVIGDIKLTGRNGTLKALSVKTTAAVESAGRAASLAGLIGQLAGSATAVKYADRARAAADVTRQLSAIQFDELDVVVARDEQNNLGIKNLTLLSPIVRLVGSGQITYQPGVPLMRQPLLASLQFGAKDKLADDLRTLKLIEGTPDAQGFALLVEDLRLDGSLQAVGTSQLSNLINRALAN